MMNATISNENYKVLGVVRLSEEEVRHFSSTGSVPARVTLDDYQIASLGIHEDDYIFVRE